LTPDAIPRPGSHTHPFPGHSPRSLSRGAGFPGEHFRRVSAGQEAAEYLTNLLHPLLAGRPAKSKNTMHALDASPNHAADLSAGPNHDAFARAQDDLLTRFTAGRIPASGMAAAFARHVNTLTRAGFQEAEAAAAFWDTFHTYKFLDAEDSAL